MEMSDKIRVLRDSLGLTLEQVGNAVGVGKSTVRKWESGDIKNMRRDKIAALARILQTTPAYLMGWEEDETSNIPTAKNIFPIGKGSRIPLYGRIACGTPILAVEDLEETVWLPDGIRADFALTCCGDSMINARIFDGDIVYVRTASAVENGEIAAVVVRDEEVTLKRMYYYPNEGRMVLRAENPTVRSQEYIGDELNHVRVLGKAIAFMSTIS